MRRVLLDSGVSKCRNVGDLALLNYTKKLFQGNKIQVLKADDYNFISAVLHCEIYYFVAGGLLKNEEPLYALRKIMAIMWARILRKKVFVDSQTVYLRGFLKALFILALKGHWLFVRDPISLKDCLSWGLNAVLVKDPLIKVKWESPKPFLTVDSRFKTYDQDVKDSVAEMIKYFSAFLGLKVRFVPTIHTAEDPDRIAKLFGESALSICASFHGYVWALNGGHVAVFVCGQKWKRYYQRKLAGVKCDRLSFSR